jgi:hypothetical protein
VTFVTCHVRDFGIFSIFGIFCVTVNNFNKNGGGGVGGGKSSSKAIGVSVADRPKAKIKSKGSILLHFTEICLPRLLSAKRLMLLDQSRPRGWHFITVYVVRFNWLQLFQGLIF